MNQRKSRSSWHIKIYLLIMIVTMMGILVPTIASAADEITIGDTLVYNTPPSYDTSISTLLSCGNNGTALIGETVTDQITFSWNSPEGLVPTGSIKIYRDDPGDNVGWKLIETKDLTGLTSSPYIFTTVGSQLNVLFGTYFFKAVYEPAVDSPFKASSSGELDERVKTIPRNTSISTLLSCGNNGENPVLIGDTVTDQITLTWSAPDGIVPKGTIEIYRQSPGDTVNWDLIETRDLTGITVSPYIFTTEPSQLTTLGEYYFRAVYKPAADSVFLGSYSNYVSEKAIVYTQLKLTKTVNNLPFFGPEITFEIRKNAVAANGYFGTTIARGYANESNNGEINFDAKLYPGIYQLCEYVPLGYVPSYIWGTYGTDWFKPGYSPMSGSEIDNAWVAVNFTVNRDGSITFPTQIIQPGDRLIVNNEVSQMPLTIGFWKNHCSASKSNGGQDPVLDWMLYDATQAGCTIKIGELSLPGGTIRDNANGSALNAFRLLNKSRISDGKKMASDPAFNLAAQFLGYRLNIVNRAWSNNVVIAASNTAQTILDNINFNGNTWDRSRFDNMRLAQITANMNYLAAVLDSYNNDTLVITELQLPYPSVVGP